MTLFYAPLQQMLMLSEKTRHFYSYVILVLFVCVCAKTQYWCLSGMGRQRWRYETCLDGNSFELKYWYKKQIWKRIGRKDSEVKEIR